MGLFSFEGFHVGQVLSPAGGEFVFDEMVFRENGNRLVQKFEDEPIAPRLIESDTINGRQDIDPYGLYSDLEDDAGR